MASPRHKHTILLNSTGMALPDIQMPSESIKSINNSPPRNAQSDQRRCSSPHTTPIMQDNDSSSDVSMAADSDEDDDADALNTPSVQITSAPEYIALPSSSPPESSKKRKLSGSPEDSPDSHTRPDDQVESHKRLKQLQAVPQEILARKALLRYRLPNGHLASDRSLLPAELWHRIFTFTPPRTLGLLMQVNKFFNASLDPSSDEVFTPLSKSSAQLLQPDAIWRASRRLFRPAMPIPLVGKSELDMWRLACSKTCQTCGKKRQPNNPAQMNQWHPGPGENGVIGIWVFATRTCGSCLQQQTLKEIDLLLSSAPSILMSALPFIFTTNENHVIPHSTLQSGAQPPSTVQIAKTFLKAHLAAIIEEFEKAKAMGTATTEEWLKGLEQRGKDARNDAARWERFEAGGGVMRMHVSEMREAQSSAPSQPPVTNKHEQSTTNYAMRPNGLPLPPGVSQSPAVHTGFQTTAPPRYESTSNSLPAHAPRTNQPRQERSKDEVAILKGARKAEIERRCLLLKPPLTAGVLAHMSSFQAAIMIIQPLNDGAWEVLKPRLLSQRGEAEQRENDRIAQTRVVEERSHARLQDILPTRATTDLVDRDWHEVQSPLLTRIAGYADEIVRDGWNGGKKVSKDNCHKFAADVLVYVRKRFYAEIAKDDAAVRATGREPEADPVTGPYTKKLTLENMKWLFDSKVKGHTEQYSKEVFLCAICGGNFKYYGFEGVVQHYAAKHTNGLSLGSMVVHWKAEWPEDPPFNADPTNSYAKVPYYGAALSSNPSFAPPGTLPLTYGYNKLQPPPPGTGPRTYQPSPAPYYGQSQYGHQNGPFAAPPQPQSFANPQYQAPQYSAPSIPVTAPSYPAQNFPQLPYTAPYQSGTSQGGYTQPSQGTYPTTAQANINPAAYSQQGTSYNATYTQQPPLHTPQPPLHTPQPPLHTQQPPLQTNGGYAQSTPSSQVSQANPMPQGRPQTEEYKTRLQDMSRMARDVWSTINSVKEVPGSVKVYTIIYHILKKYRGKFLEEPPFSMLNDGLANNKDMRPVRNVNGLQCRACATGKAGTAANLLKKHYSFPQLVNHFRSVHEQASLPAKFAGVVAKWTKDLVELPDQSKMTAIANAPGMDEQKLKLFTEALPQLIPPSPKIKSEERQPEASWAPKLYKRSDSELPPSQDDQRQYHSTRSDDLLNTRFNNDLPPSQDNHAKYYSSRADAGPNAGHASPQYEPPSRQPQTPFRGSRTEYRDGPNIPPSDYPRSRGGVDIHHDAPGYSNQPALYTEDSNYRFRKPVNLHQEDTYRHSNSQAYQANQHEILPTTTAPAATLDTRYRPLGDAVSQQNRIFEVVAQISQQAQQARGRQEVGADARDDGRESELTGGPAARVRVVDEASTAAERFLSNFTPIERREGMRQSEEVERRLDDAHSRRAYRLPLEPQRRYEAEDRAVSGHAMMPLGEEPFRGYGRQEQSPQPRQSRSFADEDHYVSMHEQAQQFERSPNGGLRRVVYRDERQGSINTRPAPTRNIRYESVRYENDRTRSGSPIYVDVGSGQYRERNSVALTHSQSHEAIYERAPRQEYVYADEPRQRQAQYVEEFEYVQMTDDQGPYVVRRAVRRELEPIYRYEDQAYRGQPVYESNVPALAASRSNQPYVEEYDPRHPAPPPAKAYQDPPRY